MIFLKILSILSQAYTLPTLLRDDLAVLEHHPNQIQKFTNPSYLAKRQDPVATLFWDRTGKIKAIFNVNIYYTGAEIFRYSGYSLAQSILTEFKEYVTHEPENILLDGASFSSQIGREWTQMFREPHGVVTIGILVNLIQRKCSTRCINLVLAAMQRWFAQHGLMVINKRVESAAGAGNIGQSLIEGHSITENHTVGARGDSKFCELLIQNWPFVFTPGDVDKLLPFLITC